MRHALVDLNTERHVHTILLSVTHFGYFGIWMQLSLHDVKGLHNVLFLMDFFGWFEGLKLFAGHSEILSMCSSIQEFQIISLSVCQNSGLLLLQTFLLIRIPQNDLIQFLFIFKELC